MQLAKQIEDAYEHLYDLVYLRNHPLVEVLVREPKLSRKDKAWRLHHILLEVIEELNPGPQAPTFSREWRRHRLMVLRYVDGLDPQTVADRIAVGRRHYYREQEAAIEAIACILQDRYQESPVAPPETQVEEPQLDRLELLRLEAARSAQVGRYTNLSDTIGSLLPILQKKLDQHHLDIRLAMPKELPKVSTERSLLRQMLLGMLGFLIERAEQATLCLSAHAEPAAVHLTLTVEPPIPEYPASQGETQKRLADLEEMVTLGGAHLLPLVAELLVNGFELQLPTGSQRTVLVVDDSEDAVELFRRYLSPHGYRVVAARAGQEALVLARELQPQAITLDLMMPGKDGWDVLHLLLNQPDTQHIPVIVCTVLRQKELALSLGAAAFLEKPVSEQALLDTLAALG